MTKNDVKSRIWKGSLAMMFAMLMLVTCMGAAASADNQMLSVTYLRREWNGTEVASTSVTAAAFTSPQLQPSMYPAAPLCPATRIGTKSSIMSGSATVP